MSLFDQIRGAIDNPNQQASSSQLGTILDTVQQLSSNHNTDSSIIPIRVPYNLLLRLSANMFALLSNKSEKVAGNSKHRKQSI